MSKNMTLWVHHLSSGVSSSVDAAVVLSIFKTLAANKKSNSYIRSKNEQDCYFDEETFLMMIIILISLVGGS